MTEIQSNACCYKTLNFKRSVNVITQSISSSNFREHSTSLL